MRINDWKLFRYKMLVMVAVMFMVMAHAQLYKYIYIYSFCFTLVAHLVWLFELKIKLYLVAHKKITSWNLTI